MVIFMTIVVVRTVFFYLFIFLIYRIMGKREVGQLGIIDLIVSILVAELAVISIENFDENIFRSIVPIITLLVLQFSLALLSLKSPKIRIFLDGNPSVIINNGQVNYKEMIKQKYNLDDLMVQMRDKGYKSIEEIEYAILENNGTLSIFPYTNGKKNTKSIVPLPLVLDSSIQEDSLKIINKDKSWLYNLLNKKGIKLDDVFYAFYKSDSLFVITNDDLL